MNRSSVVEFLSCLGIMSGAAFASDVSPNWFRDAAISPDGTQIAFCHAGDIYVVPSEGGRAIPLTIHPAYESSPVWSPDGSMIAFSSDRFGNDDVYVMPSEGGIASRLTFHSAQDTPSDFTPDGSSVIFTSSRVDAPDSALFPSGVLAELYQVSVEGGTPSMILTTPALKAHYDAKGERMLYEDRKGYEDVLRKHHTSSIARDIWLYDIEKGTHTKLTDFEGEDRDATWAKGEKKIYFLSERAGDFNVFTMPLTPGAEAKQLTEFDHHPVRDLTASDKGTLAFTWHGDLYTVKEGKKPKLVDVSINLDGTEHAPRPQTERSGATDFAVSSNGKEVAFIVRGEVFVTSVEYGTTRRVTDTPEQERSLSFAPDGRSLVYASERDGSWNIYQSSLEDDNELYFFSATKISEKPLIATDAQEFQPAFSPDGKKVAYLHDRSELRVYDTETEESTTALPGDAYYSYSDGDFSYDWAPDSDWLAVQFYDKGRIFYADAGLVRADGSGEIINISESGYDDAAPIFAMGGKAVIWSTDRYGERAMGSWGAERDVVGVFLTQEAMDEFHLSKEELELKKELEEKQEKDKTKEKDDDEADPDKADPDKADPSKDDDANDEDTDETKADEPETKDADTDTDDDADESKDDEEDKAQPIEIDLEGIDTRKERLTIHASDLGGYAMSPEGDKLYYLASFEKGYDLWVHDFREDSTRILAKLGASEASMHMTDDGANLFLLAGGSISRIDTKSGDRKPIRFSATMTVDGDAEREGIFQHVYRQTKEKFYNPNLHNVDWDYYRDQYAPKLEGITNNHDFAVMLSEFLGELNASHTGASYRGGGEPGDTNTASLGVIYDTAYRGDGMKIAEVLVNGPLDHASLDIEAGDIITAIDGVEITPDVNFYQLLDGKAGDRVRLSIRKAAGPDADTDTDTDEVMRPISRGALNQLLYERWIHSREQIVEEASGGRLGYAHVRGMNDGSFRDFYDRVMGKFYDKEALIVDTRFNGGGWLHDDLATFLTGKPYVDLYPRNDLAPGIRYHGDPAKRWTKPSILLMSESNYSDAHFFPWVYTELKIGDTVGMPVPGTATAVWWERLFTGDLVFGIPQVGTKGAEGYYLENTQLEPTYEVPLDPESAAQGTDTQLLKAVEVMLKQLDSE